MTNFTLACPMPITNRDHVTLAHGGGGSMMHQLIEKFVIPAFGNDALEVRHDGAVLNVGGARIAFTTDSYVVSPLFFPGGDIGSLAVNGTVNDLAMCGAKPLYLSCGLIVEEGLPMETLWRVLQSMRAAADAAGVSLVTGDTKVVDKGKGDGIFINTAGIGIIEHALTIAPASVRAGDVILVSGDLGRHGIAIMATREGLSFESAIESDCAALNGIVADLIAEGVDVHCMRDLTRGGLASALVEIAEASKVEISIEERAVAVRDDVAGACEILGFDPLYLANEGRFIAIVPSSNADRALAIMRRHAASEGAVAIGHTAAGTPGMVAMTTRIGTRRIVDMLSGEQLPRIC
ncbi:MAG: hydrogenase expression/formation protein HypE [Thermoanaerobaculia bacterium]